MIYFLLVISDVDLNDILEWSDTQNQIIEYRKNTFFYKPNGRLVIKFSRNGRGPYIVKVDDLAVQIEFKLKFSDVITDVSDHYMNEEIFRLK